MSFVHAELSESNGTVDTDNLAVHHGVFDDGTGEVGKLAWLAHTVGVDHVLLQIRVLDSVAHRGAKETRGNGADTNLASQIASHRQGHTGNTTFGSRVGSLTSLSLGICNRGDVDDDTRVFLLLRRLLNVGNDVSGDQAADVEGADEVDPDYLGKDIQRLRLAVPEHDLLCHTHASTIDNSRDVTKGSNALLNRADDRLLSCDVGCTRPKD